ncbi:Transcription factor kapC-like protein [Elsinoe fawcettii]|nr:Transcription factor kapC-like protein [Elsinoe fawcettii]
MATSTQDANQFEESLRNQLMSAQNGTSAHAPEPSIQTSSGATPYPINARSPQSSDGQIDPSIGGGGGPSPPQHTYLAPMVMDDMTMGARGGKQRELSSTKRAAQNRAAQRAFRQRKEAYISKLEKQVKDFGAMEEDFKVLQHENYQLREYILALQTRILDSSDDLPPPPARIHLVHPHEAQRHQQLQAQQAAQQQPEPQQYQSQDKPRDEQADSAPAAPTASMTGTRAAEDGMSQAAVEQLQAAAAEAGILGDDAKKES